MVSKSKPNVILIVLDTHRADRLGIFGYKRGTSPNLDAFAQESTVYENAVAPAQWTIPSHASMFCGKYPSIHRTLQSGDALDGEFTTIAEHLLRAGYATIGFCNNPLVGVLDNGFRRGFKRFYNYGGTVPATPLTYGDHPDGLWNNIRHHYFRLIDRIATPIQQTVAASPKVLQIALNPWLVPLWTRYSNFKGDTSSSINDTTRFIQNKNQRASTEPFFVFLNLMETHLPYTPPKKFIRKFAPIVMEEPKAKEFIRVYNTQALKWLLPLVDPYPEIESKTLHSMYDAEVAYQDHLLEQLLNVLNQPEHRENSLVIIVADHGEMLGEHQIMGHGLGVYEELVHVPLIIRFPGQSRYIHEKSVVSTVNLFHTILANSHIDLHDSFIEGNNSLDDLSLKSSKTGSLPVFSEAYAPLNLILILEKYAPDLLERFHCRETRWAVYDQSKKLIRIDHQYDELFNFHTDPNELQNLLSNQLSTHHLVTALDDFLNQAQNNVTASQQAITSNLDEEAVLQRLRNLGYIE